MSSVPSLGAGWPQLFVDTTQKTGMLTGSTTTPTLLACLGGPPKPLLAPNPAECVGQVSQLSEGPWNLMGRKLVQSSQHPQRYVCHSHPPVPTYLSFPVRPPLIEPPRPRPRRRPWSEHEDITLFNLYYLNGPNWEFISAQLSSMSTTRHRTPADVRRRYEHILRRSMLASMLESKENRPPNVTGSMQKSVLAWPGARKPKAKPPAPVDIASKQRRLGPSTLAYNSRPVLSTSTVPQSPSGAVVPTDQVTPSVPSLLSQLCARKSSPERLTISLPCPSELRTRNLSARPLIPTTNNPVPSTSSQQPLVNRPQLTPSSNLAPPDTRTLSTPASTIQTAAPAPSVAATPLSVAGPGHHHSTTTTTDEHFLVQTPTKALSETDQMSFHLASPPAVLRNLVSTHNHARYVGGLVHRSFAESEKAAALHRSVCTRLFDTSVSDGQLESSLYSTLYQPVARSIFPTSTDYDCLEVLTAKATVWNRPATSTAPSIPVSVMASQPSPSVDSTVPTEVCHVPQESKRMSWADEDSSCPFDEPAYEPLPPLLPLKFPPRQQPQLSCRRVVQVGMEDEWRQFAFGTSEAHQTATGMAAEFLTAPVVKSEADCGQSETATQPDAGFSPQTCSPTPPLLDR